MARYRVGLETRQRILDATRALLGEVGFDGTTLKAITDRAEVGAGSFYNLFDSKDDAVLEVVREAIAAVDPDPSGLGRESVDDLIDAYVKFITGEPELARIYIQLAVGRGLTDDGLHGRVLRHHRARVDRFAAALQRQHQFDPEVAKQRADAMLACLTGYALTSFLDDEFAFERYARALIASPEELPTR